MVLGSLVDANPRGSRSGAATPSRLEDPAARSMNSRKVIAIGDVPEYSPRGPRRTSRTRAPTGNSEGVAVRRTGGSGDRAGRVGSSRTWHLTGLANELLAGGTTAVTGAFGITVTPDGARRA